MSLKDLTADLHAEAETTPFMKAVFAKSLPREVWIEWTFWKAMFYEEIESKCEKGGLLDDLQGIKRAKLLMQDYIGMNGNWLPSKQCNHPALDAYETYLETLTPQQAFGHLYTWHMGDMFGGQMIKKIVEGPHNSLEFENAHELKINLRAKLTDELAPEARAAFEHAINMMRALYNE